MGDHLITGFFTIAGALIGVATIALLISKNAQTGSVLTSAGDAFGSVLSAAEAPVTAAVGSTVQFSLPH